MNQFFSRSVNLPILQNNRMQWVDYLKGIAIVLVVYRHVLIGIERSGIVIPKILVDANMVFYSFRMPLFFILAGMFISGSLRKRSVGEFAIIKFENLLYPYLIWAFLQVTLQIVFADFTNSGRGIIDYAYILYQPRNLDQFWYLPALFNATMIYFLLKKKFKVPVSAQLLLGMTLYILATYISGISMLSDWMEFYVFFALGDAISAYFFKENVQRFFSKSWLLPAIIPLFAVAQWVYLRHPENYYLDTLQGKMEFLGISLVGCLTMLILAFRLQNLGILKFFRILGFHSLYIYVMHVFAAAVTRIIFTTLFGIYDPYSLLIAGIFFGVIIPVLFYNLLIRDNFLWFLFNFRKKTKDPVSQEIKPASIRT